jgi:O-6-methylguanine DNA methyltransferase
MKLIVPRRPQSYLLYTRRYYGSGCNQGMIRIASKQKDDIWFTAAVNERGRLVACAFSDTSKTAAERSVKSYIGKSKSEHSQTIDPEIFGQIYEIYVGKGNANFNTFDLSNVSEFRRKVYSLLQAIPNGKVATYGTLAKKLGSARYARAVGTAVATNPLPLIIPCHRIVPASLKVGNYGMPGRPPSEGGDVKRGLLEREGVVFRDARVSSESIWKFH